MDGAHDLGGRPGFGEVKFAANEPAFHEAWEATAWALNILAIGTLRAYKADAYRPAVERIDPANLPVLQTEDTVAEQARFGPGGAVVVVARPTPGHTRCPAYVRGQPGVVRRVYPLAYYPELRAHSTVKCREHSYAVEFDASTLWAGGDPRQSVLVELFESYLEAR